MFKDIINSYIENIALLSLYFLSAVLFSYFFLSENAKIAVGQPFLFKDAIEKPSSLFTLSAIGIIAIFVLSIATIILIYNIASKNIFELKKGKTAEKIRLFTAQYFFYLTSFIFFSMLLKYLLPGVIASIIISILALILLFVPQSIIIDESPSKFAPLYSLQFIIFNKKRFIFILFVALLLFSPTVLLDFLFPPFFSLLYTFLIFIPLLEIIKTHIYIRKFSILNFS